MNKFKMEPYKTDTPSSYPTEAMKELFSVILSLKSEKEAADFFRDLLTIAEIKEFANRWQMVKMLYTGKSYTEIAKKLKTSTTTISRVSNWLKNGFGGYKAVADRTFPTKFHDSDVPDGYFRSGKLRGFKNPHVV
jgi:TrpR-related protein YerC/YecD